MENNKEQATFRDSIATVDEQGKRRWIYPKKPAGYFYNLRTYVSWGLLAILFAIPFIKVNGDPLLLFNVLERHFILFGVAFAPQDFYLFAIAMVTMMLFIVLFTAIYGRLFCGWVCPQTIFMEMVFRKIEYWIEGDANAQKRLDKAPWTSDKITKKAGKHALFVLISIVIAHTFLSYIIGFDRVWEIVTSSPAANWSGFFAMVIFTAVFYFVFARMREQVCIAICPYGRLQGVFLDKNSIAIMYDWVRGEPRGKIRKQKKRKRPKKTESDCSNACTSCNSGGSCSDDILSKMEKDISTAGQDISMTTEPAISLPVVGDCIDCSLCVQVCPTGIDIRNGTQLECVNCTACIDACDEVMLKIGREPGLIRYDSHNGITEEKRKIFTPRVIAYSALLLVLMAANVVLLSNRSAVDVLILRTPGMLYQRNDDGTISNLYNFQIINKSKEVMPLEFRLEEGQIGAIRMIGQSPIAQPQQQLKGALFIDLPEEQANARKQKVKLEVWAGDKKIDSITTSFLGTGKNK